MKYRIYDTENDKILDVFEAGLRQVESELINGFMMCEAVLDNNINMAEFKVISESGNYEDLVMLYEVATSEAEEKKQNIFKRAIEGIKKWFAEIGRKLQEKFGKNQTPIPAETATELTKTKSFFDKAISELKGLIPRASKGEDITDDIEGVLERFKKSADDYSKAASDKRNANIVKGAKIVAIGAVATSKAIQFFAPDSQIAGILAQIESNASKMLDKVKSKFVQVIQALGSYLSKNLFKRLGNSKTADMAGVPEGTEQNALAEPEKPLQITGTDHLQITGTDYLQLPAPNPYGNIRYADMLRARNRAKKADRAKRDRPRNNPMSRSR